MTDLNRAVLTVVEAVRDDAMPAFEAADHVRKLIRQESHDFIEEHGECPTCNQKVRAYWFTLNPNLITILESIYGAIRLKGQNDIHLDKDTEGTPHELRYSQRSNVTILRFHGLVAKVKNEDGRQVPGHWLITRRGAAFLRGTVTVPRRVKTLSNKVIDHDDQMVSYRDVMDRMPNAPILDFIDYEFPNETELTKHTQDKLV